MEGEKLNDVRGRRELYNITLRFLFDIIVIQPETAMDCFVFSSKDKELLLIDFCRDSKQSNHRDVTLVCLAVIHVSETLR